MYTIFQFCGCNIQNFSNKIHNHVQFTQFYKESTQNIFLKYTIFQRK